MKDDQEQDKIYVKLPKFLRHKKIRTKITNIKNCESNSDKTKSYTMIFVTPMIINS